MKIRRQLYTFFFPKESDGWLALLRIGLGVQLALYCFSAWPGWIEVFSSDRAGPSSRRISEALMLMESSLIPRVGWLLQWSAKLGIPETTTLWMVWSVLLFSGVLLVFGIFCRPAAVTAWFLHLACIKSSEVFSYGMDLFLNIGLFYLMLSPLPDSYAIENRIWQTPAGNVRMLGFFRRVLQLHLCFVYFFSGLAKCLGRGWWNGMNIWAALTRPPFNVLDPHFIARWHGILPAIGIAICVIEIGYPVFIWPKRTRPVWLACVVATHAAIGLTMGMYLFGAIMIVLNVAAFAPAQLFVRRGPTCARQRSSRVSVCARRTPHNEQIYGETVITSTATCLSIQSRTCRSSRM